MIKIFRFFVTFYVVYPWARTDINTSIAGRSEDFECSIKLFILGVPQNNDLLFFNAAPYAF